MAVWQFPVELVPANWAEENDFEVEALYGEDGFDTSCAWIGNQPTKNLNTIFSPVLPKADSWSEDLSLWGNDKVHDICVWHEDGEILSIGFRFDLRENDSGIMSALCEAAKALNCVLFLPGQKVMLNPNVLELKQYVLKSNAANFASDPEGFLNGFSE